MKSSDKIEDVASQLLSAKGLKLVSYTTIQSLWAGYGHICRLRAVPASDLSTGLPKQGPISLILKYISPPATDPQHPQKEGHLRKILSYQIEQYFYTDLAPQMPKNNAVAECLSSIDKNSNPNASTAMILTDLRQAFPLAGEKRAELSEMQVYSTIDWLASFHGFWWDKTKSFDRSQMNLPPLQHFEKTKSMNANQGVWLNGGYTYLATRRDEYDDLCSSGSEWAASLCAQSNHMKDAPSVAEIVAKSLSPFAGGNEERSISQYETLIHGDVKSENLFTTASGDAVAFFDFQYVGLGLGVCDLAKLFTCSVPEWMLETPLSNKIGMGAGEEKLLRRYVGRITEISGKDYEWDIFVSHWERALVDWLRFQASWGFWGNTAWLEARVRHILQTEDWKLWVESQ
ncbi:hypothetical protein Vi05172_g8730 [Venturia inaequalis]|uniref:Aminoglycoside phosphotransferase domain-containing protein n=1 Tax=Venturia inaequalis TaxID=5025 RepID=A0A8H3VSC5_VENIN|nr:hypothetical protein EG327_008122 [Venturia inaequalis]RDI81246.1 hypothetical protein Vi05172_g8730 [Venturia inaequalis]